MDSHPFHSVASAMDMGLTLLSSMPSFAEKGVGLVGIHHNDVADEWEDLGATAIYPTAVTQELIILYGGTAEE